MMSELLYPKRYSFSYAITILIVGALFIQTCSHSQNVTSESKDGIEQSSVLSNIDTINKSKQKQLPPKDVIDNGTIDVDSLLNTLSLEEKIGQLFFIRAYGYFKSDDDARYQQLIRQIQNYHIGGLIFFNGDIYGQTILTNKLQRYSEIPLWITQDMEYGAAMRVDGATRFPPAMAVSATQNPKYAYWAGKITAREAKALGVNQIFAPVLDVNNNPDNPVINVRSYSGDPDTVAKYGNHFIKGVQSEGIISTAKHFPGHGDTDTDSHLSLPVITSDFARLDSVELLPFRSAVGNGINSIMSAHIAFPNVSTQQDLPATMDSTVLNRILMDSLQFNGMVVTDGLEMKGISSHFSPGEAVMKALNAGVDMMLLSPDELTAINEIKMAVHSGKLKESRIDQSVRKLLRWKKQHGLFQQRKIDINSLSSKINTRDHELISDEISRKSLTLLKNKNDILPIRASEFPKITVISVSDDKSGSAGSGLVSQIKNHHPDVTSHVLDKRTGKAEMDKMLKDAKETDLLIIGSFIYVRSAKKVQLSKEHLSFLKKLYQDTPSVLVAFGNPYVVQDLADTDVQLMAWSANSAQVNSAVPALFGGSAIDGRLPIAIPGMYPMNHGISMPQTTLRTDVPEVAELSRDSLQKVKSIMNDAIFDSTFPGGVVTVVKDGVVAYQEGFGYQTYKKLEPIKENAIYDLASLTKVTATTPAIMKLVDTGVISLNDKVGTYIPEFKKGQKKRVTIRNLLLHNSGLPAFRVYIDSLKSESRIIEAVKNEPLIYTPGSKYEYSDLGFILLGKIVEQITGMPLNKYVQKKLYYPLGMNDTFFNPKRKNHWVNKRIPPTEIDTTYRMKTIKGEAHDERAYYLGGVAGHAGLFSTASNLAIYCQMLLNQGSYAGKQYLTPETVKTFTRRQSPQLNRGYGFDRKSNDFSTAGSLTSDKTFGHTGFTGTSYWIDPERKLAIIILTNRTYPHRSYGKNISKVRARVADAVVSSIIE
ncbi:glycoside hydrolase family 3 N-terminal domain-containing protein [Fodinibius halophilus]|uniref:beta-N-acetylhexosaminidase n=1 Tax=Fodinibius halophilus TaxID=1736908 RepID=A0A6M1T432_9BACT|nr:glycoside hydrolase family 3 N-terminal domain-containing protein [Fodinibius halophilus]NGP86731.1 serine hydrolase [Fodinibius halophilus]